MFESADDDAFQLVSKKKAFKSQNTHTYVHT